MNEKDQTRTVSGMIKYMFRGWKSMVVLMLICAVCAGMLNYKFSTKETSENNYAMVQELIKKEELAKSTMVETGETPAKEEIEFRECVRKASKAQIRMYEALSETENFDLAGYEQLQNIKRIIQMALIGFSVAAVIRIFRYIL